MLTVASTGQLYTLGGGDKSDAPVLLSGPYDFPSTISTLAVKKLLPHSLLLLEDGILHPTRPLTSLPPWLPALLSQWNDSPERSSSPIADLHLGAGFLVALTTTGTVLTAGSNSSGQRGLGHRRPDSPTVSPLPRLSTLQGASVVGIAAGEEHCLAVTSIGDVYGWGRNVEAQLFTSACNPFLTAPTYLPALRQQSIAQVRCRGRYSVCLNTLGALWYAGLGLLKAAAPAPQSLPCAAAIHSFALGTAHLLALSAPYETASPTVYVLGDNLLQQLGLPSSTPRVDRLTELPHPTAIPIRTVFAGAHSSFLLGDGRLWAFGSNQGGKLGLSTSPALPHEVNAAASQWIDGVQCDGDRTSLWVGSRPSRVDPGWLSCGGGVAVQVYGAGLFAHAFPLAVRFTYLTVTEVVPAVYDPALACITCTSPSLPNVVLPAETDAGSEVQQCEVQVSMDSVHWSPVYGVHVYVPPSFEHASFHPRGVACTGGCTVHLRVELDRMPYPAIGVRLRMGDEQRELQGIWDAAGNRVTFTAPAWEGVGEARVALSFNGVEWHEVTVALPVYRLSGWNCSRSTLSVVSGAASFSVQGCVLHERLRLKFTVAEPAQEFVVDARWVSEEDARQRARDQERAAEEDEAKQRAREDELRTRIARPEQEKDDEERRRDEEARQRRTAQAEDAARRTEERGLRWEEEDASWAALSEDERRGRGRLECQTPSFLHVGPCSAAVWFCGNETDWEETGIRRLPVEGPRIDRLLPNCGPVAGETRVEVFGDGLWAAEESTVTLSVPALFPATAASAEAVEDKEPKSKANRIAAAAAAKPPSSPRAAAATKSDAPASPPAVASPICLPAAFIPVDDARASPRLMFTTPAHAAGMRQVTVTLGSRASAMTSAVAASFTFYQPATFTELSPSSFSPLATQEAAITGRGLFQTTHARVRLTLRDEPASSQPAPAPSKSKAKPADEDARREEQETRRKAEEERRARPPVSITVPGRVRVEEELSSPKAKGRGKPREEGVGALLFTVPMAAAGWEGVGEGEERTRMEEMLGRVVDVSLAMNGQQFVPTGLTIKYEREAKGKKQTTAAADKGKKK